MTRPQIGTARTVPTGIAMVIGCGMLGAGVLLLFVPAVHGAVLLSLSGSHGVDAGDLLAVPLLLLGARMLRGTAMHRAALRVARQDGSTGP